MARLLTQSSNQFLSSTTVPATGVPLTFAAWYKRTAAGADVDSLIYINDNGASGGVDYFGLYVNTDGTVRAVTSDFIGGIQHIGTAHTTGAVSDGVWAHCAAVFPSTSSRTAYLNGTASTAEGTTSTPQAGQLARTYIGAFISGSSLADGSIAEAAIWTAALDAAEIASLAAGVSPLMVRPTSLLCYWPLIGQYSPEIELRSRVELTLTNGPTASSHPLIIYPSPAFSGFNSTQLVSLAATATASAVLTSVRVIFKALSATATATASGLTKFITLTKSATSTALGAISTAYFYSLPKLVKATTRFLNGLKSTKRIT